jgi:hypothetical protein
MLTKPRTRYDRHASWSYAFYLLFLR